MTTRRPVGVAEGLDETRRRRGDGTGGGRFREASPWDGDRRGIGPRRVTIRGGPGDGKGVRHTFTAARSRQPIDPSGTFLEPTAFVPTLEFRQAGFPDQRMPSSRWVIPAAGYYRLHVDGRWRPAEWTGDPATLTAGSGWVRGGWLRVWVNDYARIVYEAEWGNGFEAVLAVGDVDFGDAIRCEVSPGTDAGTQDLDNIRVTLELVEGGTPDNGLFVPPPPPPPDIPGEGEWLPYDLNRVAANSTVTASVSTTVLTKLAVGELIVAAVHWVAAVGGVDEALINQAGWDEVWRSPVPTSANGSTMAVLVRRADATDLSPGRIYTFTATPSGSTALFVAALLFAIPTSQAGTSGFPFTVLAEHHRGSTPPPLTVEPSGPWALAIGMAHRARVTAGSTSPLWTPDGLPQPLAPTISGKSLTISDARNGQYAVRTSTAGPVTLHWYTSGTGTNGSSLIVFDRNP